MRRLMLRLALAVGLLTSTLVEAQPERSSTPAAVGNYAIAFSGSRPPTNPKELNLSGSVAVPYSAALNPSSGSITIEGWVKRTTTNRAETLVGNGLLDSYWLGFSSLGKLRFIPHGFGSAVDSTATVAAGRWTHVAVTYNGTERRYYINGVLDKSSTAFAGALEPAPAGQPLGIGVDLADDFTENYFAGVIDTVRMWKVARSAAHIKAGMFQAIGAPHPGLLAEWRFDGDATDAAGGHHGTLRDNPDFVNDAAIPHDVRIPQVSVAPNLDGNCAESEYAAATSVTVDRALVRLMHTTNHMWVCFAGLDSDAAQLYLDIDHSRLDPAQPDDLLLSVNNEDTKQAAAGNGVGGFVATLVGSGQWDGEYRTCCGEFPTASAEFRLDAGLLNGQNGWSHVIGLALGTRPPARGAPTLWPALASQAQPSTWSAATLAGIGPTRTFIGKVAYQPKDASAPSVGTPDAAVRLIGSDTNGGEALVAIVKANLNGNFSITTNDDYPRHRLELDSYTLPKGFLPQKAASNVPGIVVDARTIDFGTAPAGTYANSVFTLGDALPAGLNSGNNPYFLIVASETIIDAGALEEFVLFKSRLGFSVEVVPLESLGADLGTRALRDNIRALERSRRTTYGGRFQYVMLIGPHSVIPFAILAPWFTGKDGNGSIRLLACQAEATGDNANPNGVKVKFSDWYYADLESNFDSNGNGCLADGIIADPGSTPFAPGYSPDSKPQFEATVALGRLPYTTPEAVKTALINSMRFEQQSETFKRQTLHAMSDVFIKGSYWDPATSSYEDCPDPSGNTTKNCKGSTTDAAYLGERMEDEFLSDNGYASTKLYESTKPVGASAAVSPQPLTADNVLAAVENKTYGVVNLAGHGGASGVSRTYWDDLNGNGTVEGLTQPSGNPATSKAEVTSAGLMKKTGLDELTPDHSRGAIFIVSACSSGSGSNPANFGAKLLEEGHGIAWAGGLSMVNVGPWTQPGGGNILSLHFRVGQRLFDRNLRLGDAVWQAMELQAFANFSGSSELAFDLYGDPSLSFWGNPGGQSTVAAWSSLRQNATGVGYSTLNGPGTPIQLWDYNGMAPGTTTLPPSPLVSNNGEVIVAHGPFVDVLRGGALFQRLNLDANAFGTPALSADGTIYVLDVTGKLYALDYDRSPIKNTAPTLAAAGLPQSHTRHHPPTRTRRWTRDVGSSPRTSPVVGSDGWIAVADGAPASRLVVVRPDGETAETHSLSGEPIGAVATDANRVLYVTTATASEGKVYRIEVFCESGLCADDVNTSTSPNTTPPLLAHGSVYLGRSNGQVVKLSARPTTVQWSPQATFTADGPITAGPVSGPGGQILVGTVFGTLYSLNSDLQVRWQRFTGSAALKGVPAFSADALYIVKDSLLRAFNPFSGTPLWTQPLGFNTKDGSVAVGYGREIYLQTSKGTVFAYGDDWRKAPSFVQATAVHIGKIKGISVTWLLDDSQDTALAAEPGGASMPTATGDSILLQRSPAGGDWEDVGVLPPGTTVFTDTGILDNTSYAYRVQLLDVAGNDSDFAATLEDTRSLPGLPAAPSLGSVSPIAADMLALNWSSPAGSVVTGYRIERSQSPGGPFTPIAQFGGETTTLDDIDLTPGTTYFYRVIALNMSGESGLSAVGSATTRLRSLPVPKNAMATVMQGGQIRVSWTGGPVGAMAIVDVAESFSDDYTHLGTTSAEGPFNYAPGEPSGYTFRIKFVQGNSESAYAITGDVELVQGNRVYVPLVAR